MTLAHDLIAQYRANRLFSFDVSWEDELIYPAYDGFSIANLPQTIGRILGADYPTPLDASLGIPTDVDRVVLFISDGMGYNALLHHAQTDPEVAELVNFFTDGRGAIPITSVAPSTTVAALTSLWTGVAPITHGMMGTVLFLREVGMLCDMLYMKPLIGTHPNGILESWGINPLTMTQTPTIAEKLAELGIPTHLVSDNGLLDTGLSKILHRGIEHKHRHFGLGDMWDSLYDVLHQTRGQKTYVSMYLPHIDMLSHVYKPLSSQVKNEIKQQLRQLHRIITDPQIADGRTLFLFVADHGQQHAPNFLRLNSPENMSFYDNLRMPMAGDNRLGYVHLVNGKSNELLATNDHLFGENIKLVSSETALLKAGLFGTGTRHPEAMYRVGDLIAIPRPTYRLSDMPRPVDKLVSLHAGLSEWEMLVSLLWRVI